MRRCITLSLVLFLAACTNQETILDIVPAPVPSPASEVTEESQARDYPGVAIDQKFPLIARYSSIDENGQEAELAIPIDNYLLKARDYVPKTLDRNGNSVFTFKKRDEEDSYWGTLVGVSNLLGPNHKEIYVAISGPGGVCCTNYSIVDISSGTPRSIYHSEDFGRFRGPIEVFDVEGDGVYELVHFDAVFRYFMDDCGSCSPEPRAVFKYDKKLRTYRPTKGIQQDFVKESFSASEKWLAETSEKLKTNQDIGTMVDLRRSLIAHVVDLLYFGDEQKAWKTFETYFPKSLDKKESRAAIKKRESKFYRFISK